MRKQTKKQIRSIAICFSIMALGLLILKFVPMTIISKDIKFDASMHVTLAIFILYVLWYFIDQNKHWRIPYIVFSVLVIAVISIQRILVNAHNDIGILLALIISAIAIALSRLDYFKGKISF